MISGIDHAVARVLEVLEERGLAENTVVVYSADNGYYLGDRGFAGKWSHYEESMRVPLIVYDPRPSADGGRGRVVADLVQNLDLPATFLSWAGAEVPSSYQGLDLSPLVAGQELESWRRDLFLEHLVLRPLLSWEGVREPGYKYARYFDQGASAEFLHDLSRDPDELVNRAEDACYAEVLDRLRRRTDELVERFGGPLPALPERR